MSCPIISSTALTLDDDALFDAVVTDDEDAATDVDNLEVMRLMLLKLTMALVLCRGSK
jgi:hypothetical protein